MPRLNFTSIVFFTKCILHYSLQNVYTYKLSPPATLSKRLKNVTKKTEKRHSVIHVLEKHKKMGVYNFLFYIDHVYLTYRNFGLCLKRC